MMQTDLFSIGNTSDKLSAAKKYQAGKEGLFATVGSGKDEAESQQVDFLAMLTGIDADSSPAVQQQGETAGPTDTEGRLTEEFSADDALTGKPGENSGKDREIGKRSLSGSQVSLASLMGLLIQQPALPEPSGNFVSGAADDENEMDGGSGKMVGETGSEKSVTPSVTAMDDLPVGNMPFLPNSKEAEGCVTQQAGLAMHMHTKAVSPEALLKSMRRGQAVMDSYLSEQPPKSSDLLSSSKISDPDVISARGIAEVQDTSQSTDISPASIQENVAVVMPDSEDPNGTPVPSADAMLKTNVGMETAASSTSIPKNAAVILTNQESMTGRPMGVGVSLPKTDDWTVSASTPPVTNPVQMVGGQENRGVPAGNTLSDENQFGGAINNIIETGGVQALQDPAVQPVSGKDSEVQAAVRTGRVPVEMLVPAAADGSVKRMMHL